MVRRKSKAPSAKSVEVLPENLGIDDIQALLKHRLGQLQLPPEIFGFSEERSRLLDMIRRTVTSGESNSALVIGPRGCGKTMLIKSILQELHGDAEVKEALLEVHLNGLVQTDDRIALREITCQLQLENTIGDRVFGSFAETLQFLLDALKSGSHASRPILFILDEFDLFTHHKNQTLLYNLFDIAQSAQTPICVVGVTCRLDVVELLEKRVKSRFSHRQVHLFNRLKFGDYVDVFISYLSLPKDFGDKKLTSDWNKSIQGLAGDLSVVDVLKRQFNMSKEIPGLQSLMLYPVCQLSDDHPYLRPADFVDSMKIINTDSKSAMLHGISILELCLIIAMKHLTELYADDQFNFEMVYHEYFKFVQRKTSMQVFDRAVVLKAFEHLIALELVKPLDSGARVQKEYRLMSLLIHPSQILDALQKYPSCPTEVRYWANASVLT